MRKDESTKPNTNVENRREGLKTQSPLKMDLYAPYVVECLMLTLVSLAISKHVILMIASLLLLIS